MSEKAQQKYSDQYLSDTAALFTSRSEFRRNYRSLYNIALKRGICDQICSHMKPKKYSISNEDIALEALKYKTRADFERGNRKAYRAACIRNVADEVCAHMVCGKTGRTGSKSHLYKYTDEHLAETALKYKTKSEFKKKAVKEFSAASNRGILESICQHMTCGRKRGEHHSNFKWPTGLLHTEALKYNCRNDFSANSSAAYQAAHQRNVLDDICAHMGGNKKHSNEDIKKEAKRYGYRLDFFKGSTGAYSAASKRGILEEVCSHMRFSGSVSRQERAVFDRVKNVYPEIKRLLDMKVRIDGKPHIKGFGVDIFLPSVKLGIEYDGTYHHSFEGLKRARTHWPDEDILNYHELKDNWFLSKGIKILHILQADWIADPDKTFQRILDFLAKQS